MQLQFWKFQHVAQRIHGNLHDRRYSAKPSRPGTIPRCHEPETIHPVTMQKAMPLTLASILVVSALLLSLRDKLSSQDRPNPQAAVVSAGAPAAPAKEAATPPRQRPWGQDLSDIPVDPAARFGRLDNGMRYIILPNPEPPGRVSVRLHIEAGSLMEDEDQRGLAHFLEHMVFNGTRNYKAEELIPKMQRLGIAFGAHANAYTSFDETVYMLDLPDLKEDTLDLAFTVMRDFGDGALLALEEIDKERGVILSEKISRDDVNFRLMKQQFQQLLPDSKISHRFPIGLDEVIQKAPRQRFVDFYQQYYIPQRMTFIVVGDIDADAMEKRIRDAFSSMTNPEKPGDQPDLGTIQTPDSLQAAIFQDPEVSSTDVSLLLARTHTPKPDTKATRAERLKLQLAHAMLDRRFERISKQKDSPVAEGGSYKSSWFNAVDFGAVDITAADDRWQDVVPILENEFRRVMEHGFQPTELEEVKSNVINAARQAVERKPSRESDSLASGLASSLNDRAVFSTPETNLAIIEEQLAAIDTESCLKAFKDFWTSDGYHLVLTTKSATDEDKKTLLTLWQEAAKQPVDPPAARAIQVFEYTDFGKPGKIVAQSQIKDLGITQLTLDNGIRINLKPTDFEKGRIRLLARIGNGKLTQPMDKPMLDSFATAVFEGGGLGKHSVDDLKRLLAGRNVSSSLSIGEDAFALSGSTTAEDFLLQCQVMCASLTDPGFRDEALWQFRKAVPMLMQQLTHTPAGAAGRMRGWLHGEDPRFCLCGAEELEAYTVEDARKWLLPELAEGYMELSIVGDFDPEAIQSHLLATFGALKARDKKPAEMKEARAIQFPKAPAEKTWTYDSKIPQGIASSFWKTVPMRGNPRTIRRLNVLADILGDRLREEIREKLGASYSPGAGVGGSDVLDGMGFLMTQSIGKPEDLPLLLDSMTSLAAKLAVEGATQDELDRSLKPLLSQLEKTKRDNGYWLDTVMSRCQEDPQRLDLARNRDQDYASITLGEINALAKKYLTKENALRVSIKPEAKEEADKPKESEE